MRHPLNELAYAASLGVGALDVASRHFANVTGTYYAGSADIGYGTEFLVGQGDGSPETFVALSDVTNVDLGGFTAEIIDGTHLRSIGRAREKLTGLRDYDPITVTCNYNRTHGGHLQAGGDGFSATHNMPMLHKNQTETTFMALVGSSSPQEEITIVGKVSGMTRPKPSVDGKMEITYTITPMRDYL
jgi:hypothetical protein